MTSIVTRNFKEFNVTSNGVTKTFTRQSVAEREMKVLDSFGVPNYIETVNKQVKIDLSTATVTD